MLFDATIDPGQLWLHAERYLTVGSRNYSRFARNNDVPIEFQPSSENQRFLIPSVWIKKSLQKGSELLCDKASETIAGPYGPDSDRFLLPIHPATLRLLPAEAQRKIASLPVGPGIVVSPTSSTRTVYVHGWQGGAFVPNHFLKLHYPGRISRFVRSLTRDDVLHQLAVCARVERAGLPCLPELAGAYGVLDEATSIGYLIRCFEPKCGLENGFFTVPGFALHSLDQFAPAEPPLLTQLPRILRLDPVDLVINRIVVPSVRLWIELVRRCAIIPELHGQNILFCFELREARSAVCLRDFDISIDPRLGSTLGLDVAQPLYDGAEDYAIDVATSDQLLSLSYDGFLVHHFLAPLARFAEEYFAIKQAAVREAVKSIVCGMEDIAPLLGETAFYFDDQLYPGEAFRLIEHPSFEIWR